MGSGLSFAAELVRQGRGGEAELTAGQSQIASARAEFVAALSQFARRLAQHLQAAGLAVSGPIELAADGLGGIGVGEHHPQSGAIGALLAADDALRDQFAALAERFEQLSDNNSRHEFGLLIDGERAEVIK